MIPILYEKTETDFVSNGIARLRDAVSCIVSEERNGVYECSLEYPMDGANYELIQIGRIIGVTHDETGDIQPFDIVSFEKPIDGVVTFHCTHISYRQSYITTRGTNINSLAAAFNRIATSTVPSGNPFTYWTDKTSTGYLSCMDGTPRTVRQVLGGIEGSILDIYGGEYEFDKWSVKLWSNRGQLRDFSIRYGVNMLDYNEECDSSGCYSACLPYWSDGTSVVVGSYQSSGGITPSGRVQVVPLDVSDKFENKPTSAQVNTMAVQVMQQSNPTIPSQNIEVSFVRLQDMGEFADFQNLMQCKLCDTINVIFPDFNSSGQFKIVQTEWNVLTGKYESMQLGDLSVTLSEALGISEFQQSSKTTIEELQEQVNDIDYTLATSGSWTYKKYNDHTFDAWYYSSDTTAIGTQSGGLYFSDSRTISIPSAIGLSSAKFVSVEYIGAEGTFTKLNSISTSAISFSFCSSVSRASAARNIFAMIHGTWA